MDSSQICKKCGVDQPLTAYHRRKKRRIVNGVEVVSYHTAKTCKHCEHSERTEWGRTEEGKESRKRVYDKIMADPEKKEKILEFWRSDQGKAIRHRYEKTEKAKQRSAKFLESEKGHAYEKQKWERHRQHRAEWIAAAGDTLRPWEWRRILRAYGKCCAYCSAGPSNDLTIDHVIPVSKGGANDRTNIVCSCWPCNKKKLDATDWVPNPPKYPLPW